MWTIWMEGYAATGECKGASFEGQYPGESFEEACSEWAKEEDRMRFYQSNPPRYWGCKMYDNESDARETFG